MKKTLKRVFALCLVFVFLTGVSVSGATLREEVQKAYSYDWIYDSLLNKSEKEITRKEFCEVIMAFYRSTTGRRGISLKNDMFFDTRSVDVVTACEMGLVKGVKENEFDPDGFISRKDAACAFYKLFEICGFEMRAYNGKTKYFRDIDKYTDEEKLAINTLRTNDVMFGSDSRFHPESSILVYEVVAALVRMNEVMEEVGVTIGGKELLIDEPFELVKEDFGEPERKSKNHYGQERYVYNSGKTDSFFMVSVENGEVKEIFTNSSAFKYGDIVSGMAYSSIDFTGFKDVSATGATLETRYYTVKLIFAVKKDGVYLDAIRLQVPQNVVYNSNFNTTLANATEQELWDIININRLKNDLNVYEKDNSLYKSLKKHMAEVTKNYKASVESDFSSIARMEKDKISFSSVIENVLHIKGGSVEAYENIMREAGSRAVVNSKTLEKAAICVGAVDNKLYILMDIYR